ncbi:MAG TPA: peptidoglycan-binding protein, partial [Candidatus Paceibacterota bacterium]
KNEDKKPFMFHFFPFAAIGTTTASLQEQIRSLQATIESLKAQRRALDDDDDDNNNNASSTKAARDALKTEIKETKTELNQTKRELRFVRSLSRGMSGDDVRDLQELLAQDPSIFPEGLITGFFGELTERALKRFQKKHGIEAMGIFGPKTTAKILALFLGRELPPGIIKRLGLETSSTTPGQGFVTLCHKPVGASPQTLVIAVPALGAHLVHGDSVGVCPGSGTPTTDTTAPTLSNIAATNITTGAATIQWTTNEAATSQVEYGTTTSYGSMTTLNATLLTSHSVVLSGLTDSTLHHFRVISKDASGNTATSSDVTFTTGTPDTAAPILSAISASSTSATTAQVLWTTNEAATSKVWYGTTTPLTLGGSTANAFNGTFVTSHLLGLSGLTASTTYQYVVESKDAANNTATSSAQSFVTP